MGSIRMMFFHTYFRKWSRIYTTSELYLRNRQNDMSSFHGPRTTSFQRCTRLVHFLIRNWHSIRLIYTPSHFWKAFWAFHDQNKMVNIPRWRTKQPSKHTSGPNLGYFCGRKTAISHHKIRAKILYLIKKIPLKKLNLFTIYIYTCFHLYDI